MWNFYIPITLVPITYTNRSDIESEEVADEGIGCA